MHLRDYINEKLMDLIENTKIFEMAISRSKYTDRLYNMVNQIIENWCLIRYCTLTNSNLDLRAHWCSELSSHLFSIYYEKLKDDKSFNIKLKATKKTYLEEAELDTWDEKIHNIIKRKFNKEQLNDNHIIDNVVKDFMSNIEYICELVATKHSKQSEKTLEKYIYEEI